jgi:MYXO-CTERM domain-containing protein
MKKIIKFFTAAAICFFLAAGSNLATAQDAQNTETRSNDNDDESDWGLLGLLGLVGLLGLRKKEDRIPVVDRTRDVKR